MNKEIIDNTERELEQLIEKDFLEWLVEDLDPDELLFILDGIGMEIRRIKGKKLPKLFLKNKLLIKSTRVKLRDSEVFPPFKWILKIDGELTKENILEASNEMKVPKKEKALSLFLQNHYEEALQMYGTRQGEIIKDKATVEKVEKKEIVQESEMPAKVEKKLTQKLSNLEIERDKLQIQLKLLHQEMKDKLHLKQNEINRLNGLLITEKKITEEVKGRAITDIQIEKDNLIKEVNYLKEENDLLKFKSKTNPSIQQKRESNKNKIALLGDPKNKGILKNDIYDIEVFDHESFHEILVRAKDFKKVYLLTWRFSMEEFDTHTTNEIIELTTPVASFADLRKKLEELSNDN